MPYGETPPNEDRDGRRQASQPLTLDIEIGSDVLDHAKQKKSVKAIDSAAGRSESKQSSGP